MKTTEQFIEEATKIHGNCYDYSSVEYNTSKIEIVCRSHGRFTQSPYKHLQGQGCRKCACLARKLTAEQFVSKATQVHGQFYDYSMVVDYITSAQKINIICPIHGKFAQSPYNHLQGNRCPSCRIQAMKSNTTDFINKANKIHRNKYSYNNVEYLSSTIPVNIICPSHGNFSQRPDKHLLGFGCKNCTSSLGENKIYNWLKGHDIQHIKTEYTFEDCMSPKGNKLPYDFYLPDQQILIEYDGIQHFTLVNFGGNLTKEQQTINYETTVLHDHIKNIYAKDNNYTLIRIKFDQDVEKVLSDNIKLHKYNKK